MKMTYRKFALLACVFSVLYHVVWMYLAKITMGDARLTASMHIALLFILPVALLLFASIWLNMWNIKNFRSVLFLTFLIFIVPSVALQLIALLACQLQGECF
jgi:Ca2+/Na+ antiporter